MRRLRIHLYRLGIRLVRLADRILGTWSLPWILSPLMAAKWCQRFRDFRQFERLRASLPATLRDGESAFRHYYRMLYYWQGSLCVGLCYDRLRARSWKTRIQVRGTPPQNLPAWGMRPVILGFLHGSGFAALRYWIRAQGVAASSFVRGVPEVYIESQENRDLGDRLYGLVGVPHVFVGQKGLRALVRFLQPGRVALLALDERTVDPSAVSYDVNGQRLYLRDGAARLAALTDAILVPVSVRQKGFCRFEIVFGDPVPDHLMGNEDHRAATQEMGERLWPEVKKNPGAIGWTLLETLFPEKVAPRLQWP